MQRKTAQKVANLLSAVKTTLAMGQRPRKLPGQWREEATTLGGKPIRATHKDAYFLSLPGAIRADAKALGYGAQVRRYAMYAILDQTDTYSGGGEFDLIALDNKTRDTRALIRLIDKAQKAYEAELADETTKRIGII